MSTMVLEVFWAEYKVIVLKFLSMTTFLTPPQGIFGLTTCSEVKEISEEKGGKTAHL